MRWNFIKTLLIFMVVLTCHANASESIGNGQYPALEQRHSDESTVTRISPVNVFNIPVSIAEKFTIKNDPRDTNNFNPTDYLLGGVETGSPPVPVDEYKTSTAVFDEYTYVAFSAENGYICLYQSADGYSWNGVIINASGAELMHPEVVVDAGGYIYLAATIVIADTPYAAYVRTDEPDDIFEFWPQGWSIFPSPTRDGYSGAPSICVDTNLEISVSYPSINTGDSHYSLLTLMTINGGAAWEGNYFSFEQGGFDFDVRYASGKFTSDFLNVACQVENVSEGDIAVVCYERTGFSLDNHNWWTLGDDVRPHLSTHANKTLIVFETDYFHTTYNIGAYYSTDSNAYTFDMASLDDSYNFKYAYGRLNGTKCRCVYRAAGLTKAFYTQGLSGTGWSSPVQVSDDESNLAYHYHALSMVYNPSQNRLYAVWSDRRNDTNDVYYNSDPPPVMPTGTIPVTRTVSPTPTRTPTPLPNETPVYICNIDEKVLDHNYGYYFENSARRWQQFFLTRSSICQVQVKLGKSGSPNGTLTLKIKDPVGSVIWSALRAPEDCVRGWNVFDIPEGVDTAPGLGYKLVVYHTGTHSPDNGFFWRGNTESEYEGDSDIGSDFDYCFRIKTFYEVTKTPTRTPTNSPTGTDTPTKTPTRTPTRSPTATHSPTRTPTRTPTFSPTPTISPTRTPTKTPSRTSTRTPTRTPTFSPMPTSSPTRSPTKTPTRTPTQSPTASITDTPTLTPTNSPTLVPTNTATETPSPTNTPTRTPTLSPTASMTDTPTLTPTRTPTQTPTRTPTLSPTATMTDTPTPTPSRTPTQSPTATMSDTPTLTPTNSPTSVPTGTATETPSPTNTPSRTPTYSPTRTVTQIGSPTYTPSYTPSPTLSPTASPTEIPTETPTATGTSVPTPTGIPTSTPPAAPSPTPAATRFPVSTPTVMLGVNLVMPSDYYRPGDTFYLNALLGNPGPTMQDVPLFIFLDVFEQYWFWPTWTPSPQMDFDNVVVETGTAEITILNQFTWPDTGQSEIQGLKFWGAMLNDEMNDIRGAYDVIEFGYGP